MSRSALLALVAAFAVSEAVRWPLIDRPLSAIQLLHVSSLVEREKNITGTFNVIKKLQERGLDFDFVVIGGEAEQ